MPREICLAGRPFLIWGIFLSNLLIWAAYMGIPLVLRSVRRAVGPEMPEPRLLVLFQSFISFCGWSHFTMAWVIWWGFWRLELLVLALTAVISLTSWAALWARRWSLVESLRAYLRLRDTVRSLSSSTDA